MSFAFFAEPAPLRRYFLLQMHVSPDICLCTPARLSGRTDWEVALSSTIKSAASGLEATAKVLLVGLRNLDFSSDQ